MDDDDLALRHVETKFQPRNLATLSLDAQIGRAHV